MFGRKSQKGDIINAMSMFSFNNDPVVVPVETAEEPVEIVEAVEEYEGVTEEDYTTAEEPDFGDEV